MNNLASRLGSSLFVRRDLRVAAVPWAVAHAIVLVALRLSRYLADSLPAGTRTAAANAGLFIYDGAWYRAIAEHGYDGLGSEGLRFFPLYPLLGRGLGWMFFGHTEVALVVIAAVASLLLGAILHRLVLFETGDGKLAQRSAWFVAVFPAAVSLVLGYAEPLFMLFAVAMFFALRQRRWLVAVLLGIAAGLTRPVGILLVVPAGIEAVRAWGGTQVRERLARLAAVAAPLLGTAVYLAWVGAVFDDPFRPFTVQGRRDLRGASTDPVTHIVDTIGDIFDGDRFGAGAHLVWIAVFVAVVVVLARRLPASYAAYAGAALALGITASNFSSFERYVWSTFPIAIGVALVTAQADVRRVVIALAAVGLFTYSLLAFFALYVP